ncbi:hypothetical protein ACEWY4_011648 [Coilia grayii]|uniref:Uncharacterized protein n=1 Tax=Coilia grayii TaxID=363190 RepID=A0ABD1JYB8_9TELE
MMAGCIRLACCKCREVNGVYVCADIPQTLRNASRLENEKAVICRTPVSLRGTPVWSVACPSPSPTTTGVPGTTSISPTITGVPGPTLISPTITRVSGTTSISPTITGVSVTVGPSATVSRATPSTLSPHTPSTGPVLGLAGLVSLIVLLCILTCVISVLSFLYHRKLKQKRVVPHAAATGTASDLPQTHFAQKKDLGSPETVTCIVRQHKGRAKSAGPVMCRSGVFTKARTTLPEDGGKQELHKALEGDGSEDGGPHATIVRVNETVHTEEHDPGFSHGGERNGDLGNNTAEDLPYLTIGVQQSPDTCDDHGDDKTGKTPHSEKMQREFARVKTWPPTAFQWARQKAKQEDVVDVTFFQNLQAELRLGKKAIPDVNFQPDFSPPGGTQTHVHESHSVQMPPGDSDRAGLAEDSSGLGHDEAGPSSLDKGKLTCDPTLPDDDHHVIDVEPDVSLQSSLRFDTHEGSDSYERLATGLQSTLRFDTHEGSDSYERLATGLQSTLTFETHEGTDIDDRLEMGIRNQGTNPDQSIRNTLSLETTEGVTDGMTEGNDDTRLEMDTAKKAEQEPSVSSAAAKKSKVEMNQFTQEPRESDTSRRERSRAAKSTAEVPPAPLKPRSPGDETLLQDNEYVFINLLHEVVENRGRWTRERWRQSHLNRRKFLKKQ